jgi:inosine-uridine nucleoside N-ribohydrolase
MLASELPLTIVPLDVARRLRIGASELAAPTGPLGEHLQCHAARWLHRSRWLHGRGGFPAFDLLAAAWLFDPGAVSTEETTVRVHPNLWLEFGKGGRPVRLVRGFDGVRILRRFLSGSP